MIRRNTHNVESLLGLKKTFILMKHIYKNHRYKSARVLRLHYKCELVGSSSNLVVFTLYRQKRYLTLNPSKLRAIWRYTKRCIKEALRIITRSRSFSFDFFYYYLHPQTLLRLLLDSPEVGYR